MNRYRIVFISLALAAATAATGQELFHLHSPPRRAASPEVIVERTVDVDLALLGSAPPRLALTLPDGERALARRTGVEHRALGRFTWRGEIPSAPGAAGPGSVTLTVHDGHVAGLITTSLGTYVVEPAADQQHRLAKLEPSRFPPCGGTQEPNLPIPAVPLDPGPQATPRATSFMAVLVVYTAAARAAAGGRNQIETLIRNAVDVTNTAYLRSDINARVVLRGMAETDLPDRGNFAISLGELQADPTVAALRDAAAADLVAAIFEAEPNSCGRAFVMRNPGPGFAPAAYSVTRRSCAVGNLTFPHELGHNLGAEHDPINGAPRPQASFPWSFGHFVDGSFRTVMAFSSGCNFGCSRQPNFSNPEVSLAGRPTGIANQRDNHRTINSTSRVVAAFRSPQADVDASFSWAPTVPRTFAPVTFTDTSSGQPASHSWSFGDGTTSSEPNPTHTYTATGIYTVRLEVARGANNDSIERQVTVLENTCIADTATLCLNQGRFEVRLDWTDFDGIPGEGNVVPTDADDSGLLWFFSAENWEMLVKVLDGCGINERYWVFAAATTNVETTLHVTDTLTGFAKQYFNPLGTSADAITDADAFATCP